MGGMVGWRKVKFANPFIVEVVVRLDLGLDNTEHN